MFFPQKSFLWRRLGWVFCFQEAVLVCRTNPPVRTVGNMCWECLWVKIHKVWAKRNGQVWVSSGWPFLNTAWSGLTYWNKWWMNLLSRCSSYTLWTRSSKNLVKGMKSVDWHFSVRTPVTWWSILCFKCNNNVLWLLIYWSSTKPGKQIVATTCFCQYSWRFLWWRPYL